MVTSKRHGDLPATLMEAHELLTHVRPAHDASARTWLDYYRHSAAVYSEVAEIDRGHHHEALYWANRERVKANRLADEITKKEKVATVARDLTVHIEQ
jgi:hypothetical protein